MPDQTPNAADPQTKPTAPETGVAQTAQTGPTINIADEFGTAKRNLPSVKILLFTTAAILIVVGIASFFQRAKPQGGGSLDSVTAVDLPGQNSVLVALTFTLRNSGQKPMWVHNVEAKLVAGSGESSGDAVAAMDFDRYFQAFPALKENVQTPLSPEDKLQPGQEIKRSVMVSFPVTLDVFNQRRSVSVLVHPYDQPVPVVLTK
jgi:hypothetical protein